MIRRLILIACFWAATAAAQGAPSDAPVPPAAPPKPAPSKAPEGPDTWIFSGALQASHETFSATLVAEKGESQFEMKLAGGATCEGGKLKGEVGLVRLPEITCSDDRPMRALFVPQKGDVLRVFGHVGDDRFMAEAHLLGTEAPPEPKQTAQPKGPLGLPPAPPNGPPPAPGSPKQ